MSDKDKPADDHHAPKQNPGVLAAIWLGAVGGGIFLFTLFFKMGMENLNHAGTSWASAKDDLISFSVGIGVLSLVVRYAIIQPILDWLGKQ